jgi:hypothetical protein
MNATLEKLVQTGIPVSKAQFHAAVNNADQIPENYFSVDSMVASRRAKMWSVPGEIILCQKNVRKEDCYFAVPKSNIIFYNFTNQETGKELLQELDVIAPKKRGRPFANKIS